MSEESQEVLTSDSNPALLGVGFFLGVVAGSVGMYAISHPKGKKTTQKIMAEWREASQHLVETVSDELRDMDGDQKFSEVLKENIVSFIEKFLDIKSIEKELRKKYDNKRSYTSKKTKTFLGT